MLKLFKTEVNITRRNRAEQSSAPKGHRTGFVKQCPVLDKDALHSSSAVHMQAYRKWPRQCLFVSML